MVEMRVDKIRMVMQNLITKSHFLKVSGKRRIVNFIPIVPNYQGSLLC
jgi:hypothetical protein